MGDAAANMARDWAADCVIDATADMKNTDAYKVYNGVAGAKEWLDFLLIFDFPVRTLTPQRPDPEPVLTRRIPHSSVSA